MQKSQKTNILKRSNLLFKVTKPILSHLILHIFSSRRCACGAHRQAGGPKGGDVQVDAGGPGGIGLGGNRLDPGWFGFGQKR